MRYFILIFGLFCWLEGIARADLEVTKNSVALGVLRTGQIVQQRFPFVNAGTQPVQITEVKPSCGCVAGSMEKQVLAPGENGFIDMELNTLSQAAGPHTWSLTIHYRTGTEAKTLVLQAQATLITEVRITPAALVVYGEQATEHELVVTDIRPNRLMITNVQASSSRIQIGPTKVGHNEGHAEERIPVRLATDIPEGRWDDVIQIHTDDPNYPMFRVPVTIVKRSKQRISVIPSRIEMPSGQPVLSRLILIRDSQDKPVQIQDVKADDAAVSCRWATGEHPTTTVRITIDPQQAAKGLQSIVHVRLSQPVEQTIDIPVSVGAPSR